MLGRYTKPSMRNVCGVGCRCAKSSHSLIKIDYHQTAEQNYILRSYDADVEMVDSVSDTDEEEATSDDRTTEGKWLLSL